MDLGSFGDVVRTALEGLCPIIGTTNFKQRATDERGNGVVKSLLIRTAASAVVAIVLGLASGLVSSYIMVQVMQDRLLTMDRRVERVENQQQGHLNYHLNGSRRNGD